MHVYMGQAKNSLNPAGLLLTSFFRYYEGGAAAGLETRNASFLFCCFLSEGKKQYSLILAWRALGVTIQSPMTGSIVRKYLQGMFHELI